VSFSPILSLYRAAAAGLGPFAGAYLRARARNGKEDAARLNERFGHAHEPRPAGPLVWLHGASVGESGVAVDLAEALGARDKSLSFLITTGTLTSSARVAKRMPPRTRHAFAPLDRIDCVRRFLAHWRPDLGVFVESELWPNLILESQRAGVTLALVNARMSPGTIARWRNWRAAAGRLSGAFALVLAADKRTAAALSELRGAPVEAPGNLKLAADPPSVDAAARDALEREIGARPVWVAASTHPGEDEVALAAHDLLRRAQPDALLIIAPRHPERGADIAALAHGAPRRALSQPIGARPVYVADTLGELGLFYSIAPAALVAGSLLPALKGHNPAEAAKLGAAVVTGPHVESFQDVFDALFAAEAALPVRDASELAAAIAQLQRDAPQRGRLVAAANAVFAQGASARDVTVDKLAALLPARTSASKAADATA
jgi:3-deoxy-D-manno-octulosonic-acid transferase